MGGLSSLARLGRRLPAREAARPAAVHPLDVPSASDFSALRRALIWENCPALPGRDPALWRLDSAGRAIHLPAYGRSDAEYGWLLHGTEALHWATLAEHGGH